MRFRKSSPLSCAMGGRRVRCTDRTMAPGPFLLLEYWCIFFLLLKKRIKHL